MEAMSAGRARGGVRRRPRAPRAFVISTVAALLAAGCTNAGTGGVQSGRVGDSPIVLLSDSVGCGLENDCPQAGSDRPEYDLQVSIPAAGRTVTGSLRGEFTPDLDTDRLVFRLWPNSPRQAGEGAGLTVGDVRVDAGVVATEQPDPTTLVAQHPVDKGQRVSFSMGWVLHLPGRVLDRLGRDRDTVWLGSFFPLLPWVPGTGWATDPPTTSLAEASTSPTADFSVQVTHPRELTVIASGELQQTSPASSASPSTVSEEWRAVAVRDFALAVGKFTTATRTLFAPHPIEITVGVEDGVAVDPGQVADRLAVTLGGLGGRYGTYPWSSFHLTVTRAIERSGIEYPTLVFEGAEGIDRVTTHELAHQWFYSLVGNDQARDPWLDETFATWAAARLDGYLDYFANAHFPPIARNHVGAPMTFWDHHSEQYEPGAYFRGVQVFTKLGDPDKVDAALRRYVADSAFGIATPKDLGAALTQQFPDAAAFLRPFGIDLTK